MRIIPVFVLPVLVTLVGCAHVTVPPTAPQLATQSQAIAAAPEAVAVVQPAVAVVEAAPVVAPPAPELAVAEAKPVEAKPAVASESDADEDDGEDAAPVEEEGESIDASAQSTDDGPRYSSDLTDEQLRELFKETPEKLGSVSFGFAHEGRILNGVRFPADDQGAWIVVSPHLAYATQETIDYTITAIREVKKRLPDAPPLRVNQISGPEGGYLRPHKSHQSGRDVDLGFYYPTAEPVRVREREKYIDPARNWELIKAMVTLTDVQLILVDRRIIDVIYNHALKSGEDKAWLDSIFKAGANSLVKHARRHRDHFHVRFYNGRAQELGRRLAPLLALRPEHNIAYHRVRSGDTLGAIANRYGTSVSAIMKTNRMRSTFLRIKQTLKIPLRKPCTQCPIPPAVVIPPRRLPPTPPSITAQL